eukprot:TRINITY_DN2181_c0_g1_i4.p1 TRINITY_DN2181_c0_g1~~TRINITY_DN2181_c0_g1_i4.p1  ORF type:complete len:550 (-),score=236.14 TRINITY_DN2181_c0_g1_i4:65-1714(-)
MAQPSDSQSESPATTSTPEEKIAIPDDVRAKLSALSAMRKRNTNANVAFEQPQQKHSDSTPNSPNPVSSEADEEAREQAKIKHAATRGRRRSAMDQLMSGVEKVKKEKREKKKEKEASSSSTTGGAPPLVRRESSLLSGIRSAAARSTQLGRRKLKKIKIRSARSQKLLLAKSRISGDENERSSAIENFYTELESKRDAIVKVSKENLLAERNLQSEIAKAKSTSPILKLAPKGALMEKEERDITADEEEIEKEWPVLERKEWNKIGEMEEEILLMESKKYDKARKSMLMDKQLTILITSVVRMENLVSSIQEEKTRLETLCDQQQQQLANIESNTNTLDEVEDDSNTNNEDFVPPPPPPIPFSNPPGNSNSNSSSNSNNGGPPPAPLEGPPPPGNDSGSNIAAEIGSRGKQLKSVMLRAAAKKEESETGDPLAARDEMMKQIREGGNKLKKVDRETEREEIVEKKLTASERLMDEIRKGAARTLKRVDRKALELEKDRKKKEEEEKKRQMGEETLMDTLIAAMSVRKLTSFKDEDEDGDEDDEWDDDW